MGKKPFQKEESQKSSKTPPTSSTKPNQNQPSQKSAEAKCTTPATAPQESKGTAQKAKTNFVIPKTTEMSSASKTNNSYQTQKGDKRARDLSQTSKSSDSSLTKPPPPKKLQSYAEVAKPADQHKAEPPSLELAWHSNQIRIYKGNCYHAPISFNDFVEIRDKIFTHTLNFM
jgi:hypothetical protein